MLLQSRRIALGLVVAMTLWVASSRAPVAAPPTGPASGPIAPLRVDVPQEQVEDSPASALFLLRQAESPRKMARLGPFTSTQVNVNASQNNIVGDAANEPTIAISPANPDQI